MSRFHGTRALVLACLVVSLPACSRGADRRETGPRGVVLISIDTLRADHLGCYGYHRDTSPFLDELAERGVLFEQAVSAAPWTLPAHATMLTGVLPSTHRAVEADAAMATSVATLAEHLGEAGFATGGFVTSWFVSSRYGFERGFDTFEDFGATEAQNNEKPVRATGVVDRAAAWLRDHADRPFFLFVHFYDPHFNYDPPRRFAREFDTGYRGERVPYRNYMYYRNNPVAPDLMAQEIALYDGEIRYVDEEIRRLFEVMEETGVAGRALTFVTSDHGEEFFERGSWGHAHTLFDELIRVPLIVAGAGVSGGRRIRTQVRHVDLVPTVLDIAGIEAPPGLHGRSFARILEGREGAEEETALRPAFSETSRFATSLAGVRRGGLKLIFDVERGDRLLYDLREDPGETRNVSSSRPDQLQALHDELVTAAAASIPDRWLLRWTASPGGGEVRGRVSTSGRLLRAVLREGEGRAETDPDRDAVEYRLEPGAVLEIVVFPVDSTVRVDPPTRAGAPVPLVIGATGQSAGRVPIEARSVEPQPFLGTPPAETPGVAFWLEQRSGGAVSVDLSDEEIRRLRSLGYIM